jgi:succinoglycan biosynthesis transport protein ExoP
MGANDREDRRSDLLPVIRRRGLVVVLLTLVCGTVAYGVSSTRHKQYTAAALLLFQQQQLGQQLLGYTLSPTISDNSVVEATDVELASAPGVIRDTAAYLRLPAATVANAVDVTPAGSSQVVMVSATATSPGQAAVLANAYARTVVYSRLSAQRAAVLQARRQVQAQLDGLRNSGGDAKQVAELASRLTQLGLLADVQTGDVQVADAATTPNSPSSPRTGRNAAFGVVLGLLIGLAVAALLENRDRRIRDEDELASVYGLPVLARIPQTRAPARSTPGDPITDEAFRLLRTRLRYFNVDRPLHTLLITSALPREGKSTVAWHLARVAAAGAPDHSVLLIEADLRRPTLAATSGLRPRPGLAEALTLLGDWREAVQRYDTEAGALNVLTAGDLPPNPTQLVESDRLRLLLAEARREYAQIIIDAPPPLIVSDALALIRHVDGVIVVGRLNHAHRDASTRLRATLSELDAPTLGLVINGIGRADESYDYGAYASQPTGRRPARTVPSS